MLKAIIRKLADPRLAGVDVDSDRLLDIHRRILEEKPMIRGVFLDFYNSCAALDERFFNGQGLRIELGAGTSFFKQAHPGIIATDVKQGPGLDMVVDATRMPFAAGSVRAFYAIHCFHHLPSPDRFFEELQRTLIPGGGCVLIDPYYSPVARVLFRRLFATERYDTDQRGWDAPTETGAMSDANQALSYIVFKRDRQLFNSKHPGLEVVYHRPLSNYVRYLLSGGLNFRQLAPNAAIPLLKGIEFALTPLARVLALHHILVLRKRSTGSATPPASPPPLSH